MQPKPTLSYLAGLLVFAGTILTLENFQVLHGVSRHWPILLALLGAGFILLYFQRQKSDSVLLWVSTFLFCLSVFFYYLNLTTWMRLATQWPVFLGIVGLCFCTLAIARRNLLYALMALAFLSLFVILGLIFSVSTQLWPVSFVVFGLSLLVMEYIHQKRGG